MTQQIRQTDTSGKVTAISVADYIVERLVAEGINHCFGVAGDYLFPICDAVDSSAKVKWIGCANELNASYAADGYARVRGAAMLATTYGVGELSAMNGVMGAKAERSLVFHVVGMPSYQHQRVHKITHHTLGDGVFGNFVDLSAGAACCHAVITPDNCVVEMERVIAERAATIGRLISPCHRTTRWRRSCRLTSSRSSFDQTRPRCRRRWR